MPIADTGYDLKTELEYRNSLVNDTLVEFPNMSTNDSNPLIVLLKTLSDEFADTDAYGQEAYNNVYVLTATGVHLDQAVKFAGISRLEGTNSVADVIFVGDSGTPISPGTIVETDDGIRFSTTNEVTVYIETPIDTSDLSKGYFLDQQVISLEQGTANNVAANTITKLVNPVSGLDSVNNPNNSQGGTDEETDHELRNRYFIALENSSGSSIKAIINNVLLTSNVTYAFGDENVTLVTDSNGLPPKSFNIVVEGGVNEDIAEAIFEVKPAGIESYGSERVDVQFEGNTYPIFFDRATVTPIYYSISITVDRTYFLDSFIDVIKNNIVEYTNSNLVIEKSRLIGLIYRDVDGVVSVEDLKFDRVYPPVNESNLTAEPKEKFSTDSDNIELTTADV